MHQADRCCYKDLHKLIVNGFREVPRLTCVYACISEAIAIVFVDDLPIFAKNEKNSKRVISLIKSIYEVKNLGHFSTFWRINFKNRK